MLVGVIGTVRISAGGMIAPSTATYALIWATIARMSESSHGDDAGMLLAATRTQVLCCYMTQDVCSSREAWGAARCGSARRDRGLTALTRAEFAIDLPLSPSHRVWAVPTAQRLAALGPISDGGGGRGPWVARNLYQSSSGAVVDVGLALAYSNCARYTASVAAGSTRAAARSGGRRIERTALCKRRSRIAITNGACR